MRPYFSNFPAMSYMGVACLDVTRRVKVLNKVSSDPHSFYPYVIRNEIRADQIADRYYGDVDQTWIVYHSGGMIDPYYDWPLDEKTFQNFIEKKYGSVRDAQQQILWWQLDWPADVDDVIKPDGYQSQPDGIRKYYEAVFNKNSQVVAYTRKRADWRVTTNATLRLQVSGNTAFTKGEPLSLQVDGDEVGNCVVAWSNSSIVVGEHVFGNTSASNTVAVGMTSEVESAVTGAVFTWNLPVDEAIFYAPVYAFDYEVNKNEQKKYVRLIDNKYTQELVRELATELRQ